MSGSGPQTGQVRHPQTRLGIIWLRKNILSLKARSTQTRPIPLMDAAWWMEEAQYNYLRMNMSDYVYGEWVERP